MELFSVLHAVMVPRGLAWGQGPTDCLRSGPTARLRFGRDDRSHVAVPLLHLRRWPHRLGRLGGLLRRPSPPAGRGLRSAVCGLRSAVCGLRSAVCGLRRPTVLCAAGVGVVRGSRLRGSRRGAPSTARQLLEVAGVVIEPPVPPLFPWAPWPAVGERVGQGSAVQLRVQLRYHECQFRACAPRKPGQDQLQEVPRHGHVFLDAALVAAACGCGQVQVAARTGQKGSVTPQCHLGVTR